jgi:ribonuclease P protein component
MQRHQRLRRRQDFAAVYGRGRAAHGDLVSVRVLRTDQEHSRFGFAVSKRVGKAVVRNRVKRRLRAAVAALAPPAGWDVVISARAPAADAPYDDLVHALAAVLRRARVLPGSDAAR